MSSLWERSVTVKRREAVHGRIEVGETPAAAAMREVREETGLEVLRLYNVRVQPFYLHRSHTVQLSVVFAAFADPSAPLTLGTEHTAGRACSGPVTGNRCERL